MKQRRQCGRSKPRRIAPTGWNIWRGEPELAVVADNNPFVGYQYGQINYIGNETIAPGYVSDNRDNRRTMDMLGSYNPLDNLTIAAKGGNSIHRLLQPSDRRSHTSQVSPYADMSATYTYLPGSYAQVGSDKVGARRMLSHQQAAQSPRMRKVPWFMPPSITSSHPN